MRPQRMSRWLVHGSRLETQGLVGDATESVDVQTTQIFAKLDAILEEAGARREDLIHIDVWLRDIDKDFSAMNEVYDEFMAAIPMPPDGSGVRQLPTRVCVGAALSGGFAVELRASAAVWDAAPPKARLWAVCATYVPLLSCLLWKMGDNGGVGGLGSRRQRRRVTRVYNGREARGGRKYSRMISLYV